MLLEVLHLGPTSQAQPKICENTDGMAFGQTIYIRLVRRLILTFLTMPHQLACPLHQQRSSSHVMSHKILIFLSQNSLGVGSGRSMELPTPPLKRHASPPGDHGWNLPDCCRWHFSRSFEPNGLLVLVVRSPL
jgi:hypothetical protein